MDCQLDGCAQWTFHFKSFSVDFNLSFKFLSGILHGEIFHVDKVYVSAAVHRQSGVPRLKVSRRIRPVIPAPEAETFEAAEHLPEVSVLLRRRTSAAAEQFRGVVLDHQLLDVAQRSFSKHRIEGRPLGELDVDL